MIFIIIITLLIPLSSSQRTHILNVGGFINAARSFHVQSLQDMYFMKENNEQQENENQVEKISGLDENEVKQGFIVEKFRSLLGLRSFHKRVSSNLDSSEFLTPSPSPSPNIEAESPSPAPSPVMHLHPHFHHQRHHFYWKQTPKKLHHDDDRGRVKRILVAVFVSLGVAAFFGAFGLILFCRKLTNHKKKPKRTMPLCNNTKGGFQNSSNNNKVSSNQRLDLFYLESLGEDIEQHGCTLKKTSSENNGLDYDNIVINSSTKEIVSVHEEVELVKHENEDKIVDEDCCNSSDDESFHSFVDSQSNTRLSNGSLSDTHTLSPQDSFSLLPKDQFPNSPQNLISNTHSQQKHEDQEIEETFDQCPKTSSSPPLPPTPPPPPPTPPLQMPLFSLHSLTSSSRVSSHSPLSLTSSHTLSSPINSETFSGSNHQSPEKDSFSPSTPNQTKSPLTNKIPPPPCPPPPFPKGAKTPPPPPSQFPQFTPLGKDGSPLPKLKPLHWDKVRAAPNRTMVWDKLRSSSFE